ncbi:MAG TPA: hypothetical protein VN455_14970 [Methanotrichaceae archaeon]|nr:hypothetical protein [Methanotrichaceae archaeon]
MGDAYGHKIRNRNLDTSPGDVILGFEDLVDRAGESPTRQDVESLAPTDPRLLSRLVSSKPEGRRECQVWGYLTSIAADRSKEPLRLGPGDFAGLALARGTITIEAGEGHGGDHIGERMTGGRVIVNGVAGEYLGLEMSGGGIVANACANYAFKGMSGGWGVVRGSAGSFLGLGCSEGSIVIKGSAGARAGWLMRGGRISILGDAGEYLGILMSGGMILVRSSAGRRAGWRMKGGTILAGDFGDEAGAGAIGGEIIRRDH